MSVLSDFVANLGFGTSSASNKAQEDSDKSVAAYDALQPPTLTPEHPQYATAQQATPGQAALSQATATDEGPSATGGISVNPNYTATQISQMEALKNLAANGGRNAASDANLARIQQGENANAAGQRGAIMQNMNARGMGGSGADLLAQLSSSQNATNNQSAEDLGIAGQEANTALNAGMGAANIGSNLQQTDFNQQAAKAQAADAIARFNAGQNTGVSEYNTGQGNANAQFNAGQNTGTSEFNAGQGTGVSEYNTGIGNQAQQYNTGLQQTGYQNQFQKQAGISGANMAGMNFNQAQANMGAQQAGNLLSGGIKLGTAAMAASGGEIPGNPRVSGDSPLNDFVPITTSPHEVVVPVSLRQHGSTHEIANFVRNPPPISRNQDKEMMLSALSNLRRRRA